MQSDYTGMIMDWFLELKDEDLLRMTEEIKNTPEDESAERWKEKLEKLAVDYRLSSRFALIRIFYDRHETGFPDITMEEAERLSENGPELAWYRKRLVEIASGLAEKKEDVDGKLIGKALKTRKKDVGLSREEALKLGHMLGFSQEEITWFLLRVFDFEDGFRYRMSGDLIEAYCFLKKKNWRTAERLKQEYAKRISGGYPGESESPEKDGTLKKDRVGQEKIQVGTQAVVTDLRKLAQKWENDDSFLLWLTKRSFWLDRPSGTAAALYRKLAWYLYLIGKEQDRELDKKEDRKYAPDIDEFEMVVHDLCEKTEEAVISESYDTICSTLLKKNKDMFASMTDRVEAWRVVAFWRNHVGNRILAERMGNKETRMEKLMAGECQVEKSDMLYLLWYGFCLCWADHPVLPAEDDRKAAENLFNRIACFMDTADYLLEAALLPQFYPPHLMEQSMLLSIVYSSLDGCENPGEIYAAICESLIEERV